MRRTRPATASRFANLSVDTLRRRIARATREVEVLREAHQAHTRAETERQRDREQAEKYLRYRPKRAAIDREERDALDAISSDRTSYRMLGYVEYQRAGSATDVRAFLTAAARAAFDAATERAQAARARLDEMLVRVASEYHVDEAPTLPLGAPAPYYEANARLRELEDALAELLRKEGGRIAREERQKAAAAAHDGATRTLATSIKGQLLLTPDCPYCGGSLGDDPHADHIYPVALGGQSRFDNMVMACAECNRKKHYRTLRAFIEESRLDRARIEARLAELGKTF